MILNMQEPSAWQIFCRIRPDVDRLRVASFHFLLSQKVSLALFRFCRQKRLLYVHPDMLPRLLRSGYRAPELKYMSFGVDVEKAAKSAGQDKLYDVVWIGRIHRQKGIDDLLATFVHLAGTIENFRAVLIGNLKDGLTSEIERLGLSGNIEFAGIVSDDEKFRLFHASRLFLMPSRFEGSPRVIAEALVCNIPVVAYEVETYRAVFGEFPRYVPCFDVNAFEAEAERQVRAMRAGRNYLSEMNLEEFCRKHSWQAAGDTFCAAVEELSGAATPVMAV